MDHNELKNIVNDSFLDRNLKCRRRRNEETQEEEAEVYLPLRYIEDLNLEEEEEVFILEYLKSLNISVKGHSSYYSGICENYIQFGHLERKQVNTLTEEQQQMYLEKYQQTKDIEIRNKIVESNLPLVKYLCRKYAYLYDVEQEFMESYGYEGLILAVDKYDNSRGKFSTYLSIKIKALILRSVIVSHMGEDGLTYLNTLGKQRSEDTKYFEYFYTKKEVEKKTKKELKDNPELIEQIVKRLEQEGYCEGGNLDFLKQIVSINKPYIYENIEDHLCWTDNDTLYKEALEKVYQEELVAFIKTLEEDLSEKDQYILEEFYGLYGRKERTNYTELAKRTNSNSRQAVAYRAQKSLNDIKKKGESWKMAEKVESFLENSDHEYEANINYAYIKKK